MGFVQGESLWALCPGGFFAHGYSVVVSQIVMERSTTIPFRFPCYKHFLEDGLKERCAPGQETHQSMISAKSHRRRCFRDQIPIISWKEGKSIFEGD